MFRNLEESTEKFRDLGLGISDALISLAISGMERGAEPSFWWISGIDPKPWMI